MIQSRLFATNTVTVVAVFLPAMPWLDILSLVYPILIVMGKDSSDFYVLAYKS